MPRTAWAARDGGSVGGAAGAEQDAIVTPTTIATGRNHRPALITFKESPNSIVDSFQPKRQSGELLRARAASLLQKPFNNLPSILLE